MKLRHLLLFLASCVLLYVSDMFAGSLIAIALIFQLNLLYKNIRLSKTSQLAALKLFVCSIPLFFFLGGIHSFVSVYFSDAQWLYFVFALTITYFLCFLANFFCFYVFNFLSQSHFNISGAYQAAFMSIKNEKKDLFAQTFIILILSFIPYLPTEWKIIFSLTVTQLYLHRFQLKLVGGF